jgi:hypothetical protein
MHDPLQACALAMPLPQFRQHGLGGIPAMDDHGEIQLAGQIKLGPQHGQLLFKILLAKEIQAQFTDGNDPIVGQGSLPQHLRRISLPVLGVQGVDTHRVAHFGEAIRQGADGRNLARLDTGMDQGPHPGLPPAGCNPINIGVELSENNVAVGIH